MIRKEARYIDISSVPELLRLAEEVQNTREVHVLHKDGHELVEVRPVKPDRQKRTKGGPVTNDDSLSKLVEIGRSGVGDIRAGIKPAPTSEEPAAHNLASAAAIIEEVLEKYDPKYVAADAGWNGRLGPLLEIEEVQQRLGIESEQSIIDMVEQRQLIGLPTKSGRLLFPALQFTQAGPPHPLIRTILDIFASADISAYAIASWFMTPQEILRRKTPISLIQARHSSEQIKEAARRTASRLSQ